MVFGLLCQSTELGLSQETVHCTDQAINVLMEIAPVVDLGRIQKTHPLNTLGQGAALRHACAAHQYRNERHLPVQGCFDFNPDRVFVVTYSGPGFPCPDPPWTNQSQQDVVFGHGFLDLLPKIDAEGDAVDVHENGVAAIIVSQTIANATSNGGGIRTPIRNYYLGHGSGHLRLSLTVTLVSSVPACLTLLLFVAAHDPGTALIQTTHSGL